MYGICFSKFSHLAIRAIMEKEEFQKKLGRRIAELRVAKGMSQNELGKACGKDGQSINKVEQGDFNASTFYMYELSRGLEISLSELFDFKTN